jgi:site-specific DNA-adenine methylase
MNFSRSKDESLLAFYENIRREVEADIHSGGRYRFAGDGVKQYADKLREEMDRRRLRYRRIDWP